MARPLRLEFAGALYHVTARGNERRAIFLGDLDTDRALFLDTLAQTVERLNWVCHGHCLMTNHNKKPRVTSPIAHRIASPRAVLKDVFVNLKPQPGISVFR